MRNAALLAFVAALVGAAPSAPPRLELSPAEVVALSRSRYELARVAQRDPVGACRQFIDKSCEIVSGAARSGCKQQQANGNGANRAQLMKQLKDALEARKWREDKTNELARFLDNCMGVLGETELARNNNNNAASQGTTKSVNSTATNNNNDANELADLADRCDVWTELAQVQRNMGETRAANTVLRRRIEQIEFEIAKLKHNEHLREQRDRQRYCSIKLTYDSLLADLENKLTVTRQVLNEWRQQAQQNASKKARNFFESQNVVSSFLNRCMQEKAEIERQCRGWL